MHEPKHKKVHKTINIMKCFILLWVFKSSFTLLNRIYFFRFSYALNSLSQSSQNTHWYILFSWRQTVFTQIITVFKKANPQIALLLQLCLQEQFGVIVLYCKCQSPLELIRVSWPSIIDAISWYHEHIHTNVYSTVIPIYLTWKLVKIFNFILELIQRKPILE